MTKFNFLIVDDYEILRHGLATLLLNNNFANKIIEAENGHDALNKCSKHSDIEIAILDISMPDMDGIEATQKIKHNYPDIEIIALSMHDDQASIRNILKAGASSYVLKNADKADLFKAIEKTSQGKSFFSSEIAPKILKNTSGEYISSNLKESTNLSDREIEILKLIVNEYTNKEIADMLYISKRTVDTHRTNLLNKTESKNTAGLVRFALKNEIA